MNLQDITNQFKEQATKAPAMDKTLKFVFDEGIVFLDLTGESPSITNDDKDADCTITTSIATLDALRKGELNPMISVMSGKVKIKGDMGVAMKLQSLFS